MLKRIKWYLYGIAATAFAFLLALAGMQQRTISKQQYEALRRERDEERARADAVTRQAQAQAKAAKDAQARRAQVEQRLREGRRNYFEQE